MAHYVYIIYSKKRNGFYIGETTDITKRLEIHNNEVLNTNSTKDGIPWELFHTIVCVNRTQALSIEKHIKRMKSANFIKNLSLYPEITDRLLTTYSGV